MTLWLMRGGECPYFEANVNQKKILSDTQFNEKNNAGMYLNLVLKLSFFSS